MDVRQYGERGSQNLDTTKVYGSNKENVVQELGVKVVVTPVVPVN